MQSTPQITFVIDRFELGSPAQQLLDRFLFGCTRDGHFQTPPPRTISVKCPTINDLLQDRIDKHGLKIARDISASNAIVAINPPEDFNAIHFAQPKTPIFFYGLIAPTRERLREISQNSTLNLLASTEAATALRLPEIKLSGKVQDALIISQGATELQALNGILSFFGHPKKIIRARYIEGPALLAEVPNDLLRAALSRTDSPQGNALIDGRPEDIAGLGLIQKYAANPRAWFLEHENGLRSTLLFLDGVVADTLLAFRTSAGVRSTQLFRSPAPAREEFSRLTAVIEDFFATGKAPWTRDRSWIETATLEHFARPDLRTGHWLPL